MKVSVVVAVLDSHEICRRQLLHFMDMGLPENEVEMILVDDGSIPPIFIDVPSWPRNFHLIATNDYRPWTQGLARMAGIREADGQYILCTDIDHILSREALEEALEFEGDKMVFQRRFAYLDEYGRLVRDRQAVVDWGLLEGAIRDANLSDGVHGNTWLMRKCVFEELGGYNLDRCNSGTHLQGEDREFNKRWANAQRAGRYKAQATGPPIYFFPMGRYHKTGDENPHGLFHGLYKEKWGDARS